MFRNTTEGISFVGHAIKAHMKLTSIVNLQPERLELLPLFFPAYFMETTLTRAENFILQYDVTSQRELILIEGSYTNYIIISHKIYKEDWDDEKLKELALEFRRIHFKSRKRTLAEIESGNPDFNSQLKQFLFYGTTPIEETSEVLELFSSFGTMKFTEQFIRVCEVHPPPAVVAAMFTFLTKVFSENANLFYKKKFMALSSKVKDNYLQSYDILRRNRYADYVLEHAAFFNNLIK